MGRCGGSSCGHGPRRCPGNHPGLGLRGELFNDVQEGLAPVHRRSGGAQCWPSREFGCFRSGRGTNAKSAGWTRQFAAGVSDKEARPGAEGCGRHLFRRLPEASHLCGQACRRPEERALKRAPRQSARGVSPAGRHRWRRDRFNDARPALVQGVGSPRLVHAPDAWTMSTGRATTVIAIIDTGVSSSSAGPARPRPAGLGLRQQRLDANDDNGHGTAVAGVAAAAGNDSRSAWPAFAGSAASCRSRCSTPRAAALTRYCRGHRLCHPARRRRHQHEPRRAVLRDGLASAVSYARNHGVVVVAAAGNEGMSRQFYPAAYPGVISVGATTGSDALYSWSTAAHGSTFWPRAAH